MTDENTTGTAYLSLAEYDALKKIEREYNDEHTFRIVYRRGLASECEWCSDSNEVYYLGKDEVLRRLTDALKSANLVIELSKENEKMNIARAHKEEHAKIMNLSFLGRLRFILTGKIY